MKCFFCDATGVDQTTPAEPAKCAACNGTAEILPEHIGPNLFQAAEKYSFIRANGPSDVEGHLRRAHEFLNFALHGIKP